VRNRFGWGAALAVVATTIAGLLAAPALGAAHPGSLDPSFGKSGRAMIAFPAETSGQIGVKYELPFEFTPGHLQMATAPDGRIVVAGSTKIARLLPNGKPDRAFGAGGSIALERPPGQNFILADMAVDSQGRILVAGSVRPQPSTSTPDPLASLAMVRRYTANGALDRSFAGEGTLISALGIEPPLIGTAHYPFASIGLRSLVVDSQDRPLLTGGSVAKIVNCYRETAISTGFVARLTESGALDPGFGEGGLRQIVDLSSFSQGALLPSGALLAVGAGIPRCESIGGGPPVVLTSLGPEGSLFPGFGFAGFRSVGYRSAPLDMTVTGSGRIVLIGEARRRKGKSHQLLLRLLSDGNLDPSFGKVGRVQLGGPANFGFVGIAADRSGRLLLAGHASRPRPRKGSPHQVLLALVRMTAKGSVDRTFGHRGTVLTDFGGPASVFGSQAFVDRRGRILAGGYITTPRLGTGGGFAIARYLGG
jgi:uncharacterized delta-60 repeat protein